MSRGAVEGAAAISDRFARPISTAAPLAHFAGSRVHVPHTALWHQQVPCKCWRYFYRGTKCAPRRARRSSQTPLAAPTPPKATAGALVATIATAARFARFHIPTPYQAHLVAASARFWRKIGAPRAVRSHPVDCACIPRRASPRTDGNQRAVSTTCRTGGVPFVPNMTNTESCRVAPRLRQYLAWGVGFGAGRGLRRQLFWRKTRKCLCSSLAPLCPRCRVPIVALCAIAPDGRCFWRNAPHYPAQQRVQLTS